jgi:hypothetical protein
MDERRCVACAGPVDPTTGECIGDRDLWRAIGQRVAEAMARWERQREEAIFLGTRRAGQARGKRLRELHRGLVSMQVPPPIPGSAGDGAPVDYIDYND